MRDRPAIIPSSDNGSSLPRVDPGPISGGRTVKPHPVLTAGERGVVASAEHNEAPRPQQRTTTTTHAFVAVTACQRAINILPQPAGATRRDPRRSNVVLRAHNIRIERPSAGGWRECCAVFGQCVCVYASHVCEIWSMINCPFVHSQQPLLADSISQDPRPHCMGKPAGSGEPLSGTQNQYWHGAHSL